MEAACGTALSVTILNVPVTCISSRLQLFPLQRYSTLPSTIQVWLMFPHLCRFSVYDPYRLKNRLITLGLTEIFFFF